MPSSPRFDPKLALVRKRECDASWLVLQAKSLLEVAVSAKSGSALVYAALEARNMIEQLWFSMIMVSLGGRMTRAMLNECRKKTGVFDVMAKVEPEYRKLVRFNVICLSLETGAPKIIEWDHKKLRRLWNEISSYCHSQLHPDDTLDDPKWFTKGVDLVAKATGYVEQNLLVASTGLGRPESMTPEAKLVWNDFSTGKIDEDQAYTRLRLVQPLSQMNRKGRILVPRYK